MLTPKLLNRLIRVKLGLIVALVVTVALLLSGARVLMYSLPAQKSSIERWLSSDQYQVSIDEIQGEWHHLWPFLDARGVTLKRSGGAAFFKLGHLRLKLNMMQSLMQGTPVFHQVVLDRLELQLFRSRVDGWRIQGIGEQEPSHGKSANSVELASVFAELKRHGEIRLVDAIVSVDIEGGQQFPPQVINAGFQNRGEKVSLQARLERIGGDPVDFRLLGQGLPGSDDFAARFYLRSPQLGIGFWRQFLPAEYAQLEQFSFSSEFWGQWRGTLPTRIQGNISVPELSWRNGQGVQRLEGFSTRLLIDQQDGRWQMQLDKLLGQINQQPLAFSQLHGNWKPQQSLLFSTDKIDLKVLNSTLLSSPVVPDAVKKEFSILRPAGVLRNIQMTFGLDSSATTFQLLADLDRVEVASWNGAPEIRGVDGLLRIDQDGGQVDFNSQNILLNFPDLYQQGWMLDQASGVVGWTLDEQRAWVESGLLQVKMKGVEGNGRFSLDMPFTKDVASDFVLMIGMDNSNGQMAPLFVPDKIIDKGLFSWLESSIKAGHLNSGGFFYQGALEPWAPDPVLQMHFDVSDGHVQYQPDWPGIRQSKSFTLVKNTELLVEIESGEIYDTKVLSGEVYLPPDSQILQIKAKLDGPAADGRKVLLSAPTKEFLGDEFAQWQLQGQANTALDLAINLEDANRSKIRVSTDISDGHYYSKELDLDFSQLLGQIRYHETKGLSSGKLTGRFFGQPITAKVSTLNDAKGSHTIIDADGVVEIAKFNQWLKQPVLDLWQGKSRYQARLDICSLSPDCTSLEVTSNLKGVSTQQVPIPYAKNSNQHKAVKVKVNLTGPRQWLRINYGKQYQSLMALNAQGLSGGEIVLGNGQGKPKAIASGLQVRGALEWVDPQQWQQFIGRLFPDSVSSEGRPQIDPILRSIEISANQVVLGADSFNDVTAHMVPSPRGWEVAITSPSVQGDLSLPIAKTEPFTADFDYLYLPQGDSAESTIQSAQAEDINDVDPLLDFDPATLPAMILTVDDFRIGKDRYGRWKLGLKPIDEGVHISGVEGLVKSMSTRAELWWKKTPAGHRTTIDVDLKADQLAEVQKDWGALPVLESENAHLSGQMDWRGSPLYFNVESLNGLLDIQTGEGRFIDTGSAGGVLKLFGLLNFNALGRRLKLDFTDLSKKGLSFDEISAGYHIKEGVGLSTKPFKLSGPSAAIEMQGSFNLTEESLDQNMSVALPLAGNISLTAVLLGTPQVAGAVFLIEKLVGKQIQKFTSARYTVTGSWHDPVIAPLRAPQVNDSNDPSFN